MNINIIFYGFENIYSYNTLNLKNNNDIHFLYLHNITQCELRLFCYKPIHESVDYVHFLEIKCKFDVSERYNL